MNRSILGCTVLLFLMIAFSSGISIIPAGGPESAGERNNGQQIAPANSYTPHGLITITSNADFSSQGWLGNGTLVNPYIIEGLNITADAVCISIRDTTAYFEVSNCLISSESESSYDGIVLDNVTHGTARNCTIDRHHFGISITESISCTLINNIAFSNSWYGFFVNSSDYCALTNNTATSNYYGFSLSYSDNCTLMNNTATSNYDMGFIIGFSNCSTLTNNTAISNNWGFNLYYLNYSTITSNTAFDNNAGFVLELSNNCNLTYNTASSNGGGGVFLGSGSDYNILYLNRFGNNGGSNAQDSGASNLWDDSVSSGNYWMDYNGIGIYLIPGSAGSVDNYPLVWDIVTPSVDNPSDVEYLEGESGNSITWNPSDDHPKNYTIYRNDIVIVSESWNGSSITIEVDGLSLGLYNYTLVVTDMVGKNASDEVLVTVVDGTIPTIDSPADFQYDEFSTGHSITWHPSDLHPQSYVIYMDGSPVKSGVWNSSSESITVSVDGLDLGVYNYTLLVADIVGYSTSDEVLVTVVDGTAPIVDSPADFQYDEFSTGHSITWHPSDLHPQSYVIYMDGSPVKSGVWNSSIEDITISIDGLSLAEYNYTLVVTDMGGNSASDEILVTVVDATYPTIDSPADIEYEEFTTGHVLTWHPTDANPQTYIIYRDGMPVESGAWNSSSELISVSVDGLDLGTHIYNLVVTDVGGNSVIDTILVTVLEAATATTTPTTATNTTPETGDIMVILVLSCVGIVGVVIVIIVVLKKRGA